jgi:hypothetical protein
VTTTQRHIAAELVEEALRAVYEPSQVALLREDSPLSALGASAADMVCIADALAVAARHQGRSCVLDDSDVDEVATVADLIGVVLVKLDAVDPADAAGVDS